MILLYMVWLWQREVITPLLWQRQVGRQRISPADADTLAGGNKHLVGISVNLFGEAGVDRLSKGEQKTA